MSNESRVKDPGRRQFFGIAGGAIGAAALASALPQLAHADDLPHLTTADPTAQALGYSEDASKVDAAKYPTRELQFLPRRRDRLRPLRSLPGQGRQRKRLVLGVCEEGLRRS